MVSQVEKKERNLLNFVSKSEHTQQVFCIKYQCGPQKHHSSMGSDTHQADKVHFRSGLILPSGYLGNSAGIPRPGRRGDLKREARRSASLLHGEAANHRQTTLCLETPPDSRHNNSLFSEPHPINCHRVPAEHKTLGV